MLRPDRKIRGSRIRILRDEQRLSRRALAQRVPGKTGAITEKTIERAEKGDLDTEDATIEGIAVALGVDRDELDGDLRIMRLPGFTELREQVAFIWAVLQAEFPDAAGRVQKAPLEPLSGLEALATRERLEQRLEELARQADTHPGSTAPSKPARRREGQTP